MGDKLRDVIYYLTSRLGVIESRTKLVKLLYLSDVEAKERLGRTITGLRYIYHFYGPYAPEIIEKALEMDGEEIREVYNPLFDRYEYYAVKEEIDVGLDPDEIEVLNEVIKKYGRMSTSEIKEVAYNTEQMKKVEPGEIITI